MNIIAIAGRMGSGKDTIATIIQALTWKDNKGNKSLYDVIDWVNNNRKTSSFDDDIHNWQIKRFADKVKDIVCLLINCTREQLEDREFKEAPLGKEWNQNNYCNFCEEIVIPSVSNLCSGCFDLLNTKQMTPRLLLQLVGTDCGRKIIHPNLWVNSLFSEYKPNNQSTDSTFTVNYPSVILKFNHNEVFDGPIDQYFTYPNWIIPDMRFPNEYKAVQEKGGLIIRVERDSTSQSTHESETALDNTLFENVIINNGTIEDLINKVKELLIKNKII